MQKKEMAILSYYNEEILLIFRKPKYVKMLIGLKNIKSF